VEIGKQKEMSPFASWFMAYADENQLNLADLARLAHLSHGTLRSLRDQPERVPTLETCLRLSDATRKPINEVLCLAGIAPLDDVAQAHPDRAELLRTYDNLPDGRLRQSLLDVARAISRSVSGIVPPQEDSK
jgi:hypothetical protein